MIRNAIAKILLGLGIILCAAAVKIDETVTFEFMKEMSK